jgi:hypothetical protein
MGEKRYKEREEELFYEFLETNYSQMNLMQQLLASQ